MIIGFGNGDFCRLYIDELERYSDLYTNLFKANNKTNALEIHCLNEDHMDYLINSNLDLSYFKYLSLHAPDFLHESNNISRRILSKLVLLYKKYKIQNIVFHVDKVKNWDLLLEYNILPISIENMDDQKNFGRSIEDIKSILDKYNFNLTLDLQHCFVNDNSMRLALNFQTLFKNRIVEYHISGYEKTYIHYPLFKTLQNKIIDSLKYKNTPIIIESIFDKIGDHEEELEYIIKKLN